MISGQITVCRHVPDKQWFHFLVPYRMCREACPPRAGEQIVNKTFVKMMDELGYDVELTYKKKAAD